MNWIFESFQLLFGIATIISDGFIIDLMIDNSDIGWTHGYKLILEAIAIGNFVIPFGRLIFVNVLGWVSSPTADLALFIDFGKAALWLLPSVYLGVEVYYAFASDFK